MDTPPAHLARREWRRAQIAPTLRRAAELPFYRSRWGDGPAARAIATGAGLEDVPTFGRDDYEAALDLFTPDAGAAELWTNWTSGSSGAPVPRHRPLEEVAYIERFLARLASRAPVPGGVLTSHEWPAAHGRAMHVRTSEPATAVPTDDPSGPARAVEAITRPAPSPGGPRWVGTLVMGLEPIVDITNAMEVAGWPPHRVRVIVTVGGLVTPWQRTVLERLWGARVVDRFSASEVIGGASICGRCGWYHPDPYVVYGCVEFDDVRTEVAEGIGLLTMTELWPLSRARPLVRYRPGDLVEVRRGACTADDLSFVWLGRAKPGPSGVDPSASLRVPWTPSGRPVLRPAVLHDVIGREPAVGRAIVADPHLLGEPRFGFEVRPGPAPTVLVRAARATPGASWSADPVELARRGQPELVHLLDHEGWRVEVQLVDGAAAL